MKLIGKLLYLYRVVRRTPQCLFHRTPPPVCRQRQAPQRLDPFPRLGLLIVAASALANPEL